MSLGAEPPRHADRRLDEAGLRAALLLEAALDAIVIPVARERFASLRAVAADLRDASGAALRRSAVVARASAVGSSRWMRSASTSAWWCSRESRPSR